MTHDIIGQQLDEALRLVEPCAADIASMQVGLTERAAWNAVQDLKALHGKAMAAWMLSGFLEDIEPKAKKQ